MVAVFKMAVLSANLRKWKLSCLKSVHKYANCVDPTLHRTFYSRNVVHYVQYSAFGLNMFGNDWLETILFPWKKSIITKKYQFCVRSQISTLFRSTSSKGFFVHRAQRVANNISKNLNSHKMFFCDKIRHGWVGTQIFSTFGPPDASRKKTIKFRLMRDIAFYSPCFCLSNRVWHEQIVSCMLVTDPNNFKCHGTIFAIFWHQKTHYFLQGTHQNLTHRMHDATHCMHHGTCATHVPWCMSGSLTNGGGENVPGIPGARANRNCAYL